MLAPTLRRAIIQSSPHNPALPPAFLLPLRANLSTAPTTTSTASQALHPPKPLHISRYRLATPRPPQKPLRISKYKPATPHPPPKPLHISKYRPVTPHPPPKPPPGPPEKSTLPTSLPPALLPLLAAQRPHYITAHIHARRYLLTAGDTLRLPFHMPHAPPGTILRLNRASSLGSRDYTFRGAPWIDEGLFVCRARVVGVEGEPMRVIMKTKQRQRHAKRVTSKMRFTVLRCVEVRVLNGREEVEGVEGVEGVDGVDGEKEGI